MSNLYGGAVSFDVDVNGNFLIINNTTGVVSLLSSIGGGGGGGGAVSSVNGRTGAVSIISQDVVNGLGYTPYNSTNPSGFISNVTSAAVTSALGFTPYSSANPLGFISTVTNAAVTSALGFTPYSSANPNNYISANQTITLSGDASGSGTTAIAVTLASVNSNVGTFTNANITVDGKGRITAASTGSAGGTSLAIGATISASRTLVLGDANTLFPVSATSSLTVPPNSSVAFPLGTVIAFEQLGSGAPVTLVPGSGVTLNSSSGSLATSGQYQVILITQMATNTWVVTGVSSSAVSATAPKTLQNVSTAVAVFGNVTFGANGAFTSTAGTGIVGSFWCYFPANVITGSNAAGVYWVNCTANTRAGAVTGTAYNVTLPAGTVPFINTTLTGFSSTAQAAATLAIGTYPFYSFTVPANSFGIGGSLDIMAVTDCQGSVIQFTLGGSAVGQTAASGPEYYTMSLMNANATNRQVLRNVALDQYNVSGGFGPTTLTVDTTSAQTLVCQANVTTAGQTTSHQFSRFVLYPTSP